MSGAVPPLPQYAFMAWCSVRGSTVIIEGCQCYQLHAKLHLIILLSRLTPYADEIIADIFRRNRSATDHIFCIREILRKKWEYNRALHQLFTDSEQAYDSATRNVK
jgi:hypothetical protein